MVRFASLLREARAERLGLYRRERGSKSRCTRRAEPTWSLREAARPTAEPTGSQGPQNGCGRVHESYPSAESWREAMPVSEDAPADGAAGVRFGGTGAD